jgi:sortase (surface protein transpeptidase)
VRRIWSLLVLGLALLAGCAAAPIESSPAPSTTISTSESAPRVEPAVVDIPKIGARSTLVPLGLNPDSTIEVPPVSQPLQAGWYSLGPAPGELGPAVLLGHVDGNKQKGIFYRLKELAAGDVVTVSCFCRCPVQHL